MYGMHPQGMKNDKAREKEADHQSLTPANKQEKLRELSVVTRSFSDIQYQRPNREA